jgi:flavin reductase (DIM6/NTAB) family NADH-FMN oxidoreductase RutF
MIGDACRPVTSSAFREVIGHFTSGVTVITARHDGRPFATTVSAVSSVSDEPPTLLACLNRGSDTGRAIEASGRFGVNVLRQEQEALARQLARKGAAKLDGVAVGAGRTGVPVLDDGLATLECRVVDSAIAATHVVYFAEVEDVLARVGVPLVYFRGAFVRLDEHCA